MAEADISAFFLHASGLFEPTPIARGPWDPNSLHGRVVAALLARAIEEDHGDPAFHFARLTVDLFRLPPLTPLAVSTQLMREGNRIRVVDSVATSEGLEVARARAVMLRRADPPEGNVWSPPAWDAPLPDLIPAPVRQATGGGRMQPMWDTRPITGGGFGEVSQKRTWLRETHALVDGEELTPFVRVAMAADFANPFANSGDKGLNYVNADITLYLHRLPVGEWLGFEVASHQAADGIAVGECTIYDTTGPTGRSIVCGVANRHRR